MKKTILFTLFLIGGTVSFASANVASGATVNECVTVNTSCGVVGCGATTEHIIEAAEDLEEWQCGSN